MHIRIHTNNGGTLDIEEFNDDTFMNLRDSFNESLTNLLTFDLGEDGMAYIPKAAVSRIDVFD